MTARASRAERAHAAEILEFDSREKQRARLSPHAIKAQLVVLERWFDSGTLRGFAHPETEALVAESDRLLELIDRGEDISPAEMAAILGRPANGGRS